LPSGLGVAFDAEIDRQASRIADNPLQFPIVLPELRRARLRRFPTVSSFASTTMAYL